jgi:HAD superfamily hydrolase (TIGR01509 family)
VTGRGQRPLRGRGIRAVLFDLDGVLIDSYEVWFHLTNGAAQDLGYPEISRKLFAECWGQGIEADVARFYPDHTIAELERYYGEHFIDHSRHLDVDREAPRVLDELRSSRVGTAVITNTPSPIARGILEAAGLAVDVLVGGTDVPRPKPAPDMVQRACEVLGVALADAVVVGDTRFDLEAAEAAGVRTVGLRIDGDQRIERLEDVLSLVSERA